MPEDQKSQALNDCGKTFTSTSTQARTDQVWWLLAPNPFVVLADAAPQLPPETAAEKRARQIEDQGGVTRSNLRDSDPLGALGRSVRDLRSPPGSSSSPSHSRSPVWPYGLAFDVLLGVGAVWLTARRLRTPTRNLPTGQRVA